MAVIKELTNEQKKELALLITLGLIAIKTTPYGLIKGKKIDIGKTRFLELRKKGPKVLNDYILLDNE